MSAVRSDGFTLLELIAALAVMAVTASVVLVALPDGESQPPSPQSQMAAARMEALETGTPITVHFVVRGTATAATALPDGRVVADSMLGFDPLTGRVRDAAP